MANGGDCFVERAPPVGDYIDHEIVECQRDIERLTLQLSIDSDYVDSPEAEPGEIDYFRLQVRLERLEVEFLNRRLAILQEWRRP